MLHNPSGHLHLFILYFLSLFYLLFCYIVRLDKALTSPSFPVLCLVCLYLSDQSALWFVWVLSLRKVCHSNVMLRVQLGGSGLASHVCFVDTATWTLPPF